MPRGDRMGPAGMGSMTGRGMGYCAGYAAPGYANPAPGFGRGRGQGWWGGSPAWRGGGPGWGGGRGWRHRYYATGLPGWARYSYPPAWAYGPYGPPVTEEQETDLLKDQAEVLKRELEAITQRLEELEKKE